MYKKCQFAISAKKLKYFRLSKYKQHTPNGQIMMEFTNPCVQEAIKTDVLS